MAKTHSRPVNVAPVSAATAGWLFLEQGESESRSVESPPTPHIIHCCTPYSVHRHSSGIYISLQSWGKLTSLYTGIGFSSTRWAALPLLPSHWLCCGHMVRLSSPWALPSLPSELRLFAHVCEVFCWWACVWVSVLQGFPLGLSIIDMFRELSESTDSECLGSMTPETQDIYQRMDHRHRRSSYRLGRIIARQQLLKRIARGTTRGLTLWFALIMLAFISNIFPLAVLPGSWLPNHDMNAWIRVWLWPRERSSILYPGWRFVSSF